MFDQAEAQADVQRIRRTYDVNLTSAASVLEPIAAHMAERGTGWIAAVSSVAGDRGRQSNYLYGSAKAGLTAYLQGLRNRVHHHGVDVLTIKPGFVDTPMTHGLLDPDSPLVASPDRVAKDIDRAIRRRRSKVYTPWFWRGIMAIIRNIPEAIFKRLKL
jgi:short-subunit dehydrogenase